MLRMRECLELPDPRCVPRFEASSPPGKESKWNEGSDRMFVPKEGAGLRLSIASELCEKNRMKTLDQRLLDTATRRLVVEFQPEQVWLYGSHAWGQPHADSDVDLLVVVPHSDESPIRRSQRAHRCLRGLRMPKDVLVETRQEVDRVRDLTTSLENTILTRGRRLYG